MTTRTRRKGDSRPMYNIHGISFALTTTRFRWLPRHGEPYSIGEWIAQHTIKKLSYLPIYAVVVGLIIGVIQVIYGLGV